MTRTRGFTIAEVIIATLLAAMIAQGVFLAILSSRQKVAKTDTRTVATAYAKRVMDELGNYVTSDPTPNPGNPSSISLSPSGCSWNLPLPGTPCVAGWALTPGAYDLGALGYTNLLPAVWAAQHGANLSYTVGTPAGTPAGMVQVQVTMTWTQDQ